MRARNAGSDGARGECIFMDSANAAGAERAWGYSCGHRTIRDASAPTPSALASHHPRRIRPDTLGIGIINVQWTLNTGNGR